MSTSSEFTWFVGRPAVIGMVHLLPLPGSPGYQGSRSAILERALGDAETLVENGIDALMLENIGDTPFYPQDTPPVTVACMTAVATEIKRRFDVLLGINVLRNDAMAALAVAAASRSQFIRVNVLAGTRVSDQGLLTGNAHLLLRERARMGMQSIGIFADVNVKHSAALAERPLWEDVRELVQRSGADAVIVSGSGTGQPTAVKDVAAVEAAAGGRPVLVGSGVCLENVAEYLPYADGYIVGTSLHEHGQVDEPISAERVNRLMSTVRDGKSS